MEALSKSAATRLLPPHVVFASQIQDAVEECFRIGEGLGPDVKKDSLWSRKQVSDNVRFFCVMIQWIDTLLLRWKRKYPHFGGAIVLTLVERCTMYLRPQGKYRMMTIAAAGP